VLHARAQAQPQRVALSFLRHDAGDEQSLTWAALDRRARAVAARLQASCAPGARVLLVYPPGLDFVAAYLGCLYAGVVGVPVSPPRNAAGASPLESVADDAQAERLLTSAAFEPLLRGAVQALPAVKALPVLASDDVNDDEAESWRRPALRPDTLAFLQYTSGSTGAPKGVMVSHANLLHNLEQIRRAFGCTPASRCVIWLPPYHDMGLIGGLLQPLYTGFPVTLLPPADFLQRPLRWLQAVSRRRATVSGGPSFAYELCVRRISDEDKADLDLSHWDVAFNGAETIDPDALDRFAEAFAPCGFRREAFHPCYGLAEATLMVTAGRVRAAHRLSARALERREVVPAADGEPAVRRLVGCGALDSSAQQVLVVDPLTRTPVPPGRVGEVWVAGPSVAAGYWRRPDDSAPVFRARLRGGRGPFLRTGDLGCVLAGQLVPSGRLKDLIIVRGRNHAPEDIEASVGRCHPALRPGGGAAFGVLLGGLERVVVVHEVERTHARGLDTDAVQTAAREAVAARHGLQLHELVLLKPAGLPRTTSGKVRRQHCRALFLEGRLPRLAEPGTAQARIARGSAEAARLADEAGGT
jgi:acyl-CoA synthetase (AMP-forming)/AMP-acid ligase II